jgi:hypothetical protein
LRSPAPGEGLGIGLAARIEMTTPITGRVYGA